MYTKYNYVYAKINLNDPEDFVVLLSGLLRAALVKIFDCFENMHSLCSFSYIISNELLLERDCYVDQFQFSILNKRSASAVECGSTKSTLQRFDSCANRFSSELPGCGMSPRLAQK